MPQALCFDMYGTLCDTRAVESTLADRVDRPRPVVADIAALWRRKQLEYSYQVSMMAEAYESFWELTAHALDYALDFYGVDTRALDRDAVLAAYETLDAFPDAEPTLERIVDDPDLDLAVAILSNGSPDMLDTLADNTGLAPYFDVVFSADEVRTFKPSPAVYEHAADRLDRSIETCWLVSSNAWDVAGATAAGMGAAWVNRDGEPPERVGGEPTVELETLADLPEALADAA